ncbi:glycosyltransferase family 4 protein [Oxynema sp. CENA135]|uniref:glycosyltransferase family 4 protein n=1 Tax=Oxynema sp. CENA135 TaxID=984206 RepID=UPI00190DA417|nr:glycosyltransferase family 4 protein [Oxynema sp. CENA135]MBK4732482.1 glycosyltransferase family 4 protein [Oxynema sp. CENA135]
MNHLKSPLNVVHLSTFDISGGAARAAYRVHQGLKKFGVNSQMLVRVKSSQDPKVLAPKTGFGKVFSRFRANLNSFPLKFYSGLNYNSFSPQWCPDGIDERVATIAPDIVCLHWVGNGYLQLETLAKLKKPLIWTLMDMWPFTGGCYYSGDCDRYRVNCGACPFLNSQKESDLSRWIWNRKAKVWKELNLTVVAPSQWLAQCARSSSLLRDCRVEVIPFALDTQTYKPIDRHTARQILNLPQDKDLILFGAIQATKDPRKGFSLLQEALQQLSHSQWQDRSELVIFGSSQPEQPIDLGLKTNYLGHLHDDISLSIAYAAADVAIVPSKEEAFGQTASESLACGTPVVTFNATGLKDIVDHQQNGYLVKPFDSEDLARGIAWVLDDRDRHRQLKIAARAKAEREFSLELQASRYVDLFTEILERNTTEN